MLALVNQKFYQKRGSNQRENWLMDNDLLALKLYLAVEAFSSLFLVVDLSVIRTSWLRSFYFVVKLEREATLQGLFY